MFSGIVEETGTVKRRFSTSGLSVLEIAAEKVLEDLKTGDSISVSGVCLTVEKKAGKTFTVSLSRQTMKETSLGNAKPGAYVNLERALKTTDRLGGHILTGHIDFKTPLRMFFKRGADVVIGFGIPEKFEKYVVERGSIGVDGLSLTVAEMRGPDVKIFIIPYTMDNTNLKHRRNGDMLNIEVDITAKHLEKLLESRTGVKTGEKETIDESF